MDAIIFNKKLTPTQRLIMAGVQLRPGSTRYELAELTGASKVEVSRVVKRLIDLKHMRKEGNGGRGGFRYYPA